MEYIGGVKQYGKHWTGQFMAPCIQNSSRQYAHYYWLSTQSHDHLLAFFHAPRCFIWGIASGMERRLSLLIVFVPCAWFSYFKSCSPLTICSSGLCPGYPAFAPGIGGLADHYFIHQRWCNKY